MTQRILITVSYNKTITDIHFDSLSALVKHISMNYISLYQPQQKSIIV